MAVPTYPNSPPPRLSLIAPPAHQPHTATHIPTKKYSLAYLPGMPSPTYREATRRPPRAKRSNGDTGCGCCRLRYTLLAAAVVFLLLVALGLFFSLDGGGNSTTGGGKESVVPPPMSSLLARYIVCLGDSITILGGGPHAARGGWVDGLQAAFESKATVINAGIPGFTSGMLLAEMRNESKLAAMVPFTQVDSNSSNHEVLFVTLMLGSNDGSSYSGVKTPVNQFTVNMRALIKLTLERLQPRHGIFLLTPPPVDHEAAMAAFKSDGEDRSPATMVALSAAVVALAAEFRENVTLVDVRAAMLAGSTGVLSDSANAQWKDLLSDGLHLNEEGNVALFSVLSAAMKAAPFARSIDPGVLLPIAGSARGGSNSTEHQQQGSPPPLIISEREAHTLL